MKKINLFLIAISFLVSVLLFQRLPALIPMHWNIQGNVDNYMPKFPGAFFLPFLTLILFIGFLIIPNFDPKKEKYKLFKKEWDIIQTVLIGFFTYVQFITLYISLNPKNQFLPLMFIGLGTLFILLGNYLSKIRQNYFIGIKVPWTLTDEDNWNKTHRFASWCFVIAGILTLTQAVYLWYAPVIIFISIILASLLPIIYSFLLFKKQPQKMKYVYLFLVILGLLVFVIRFTSPEDDWICNNGNWVKHGQSSAPKPEAPCQ